MKITIYDSKDLNFVELNFTGSNEAYIRCDKESKYIDSTVFNIFTPYFEGANKLYEYYGPTKYNARKIIPLRNELIQHYQDIEEKTSAEFFEEFISSHFLGKDFIDALAKENPDWMKDWKSIQEKILIVNKELIDLTEKCADEEKILWVIGY